MALVSLTNHGFFHRVERLLYQDKWLVLTIFIAMWGLSLLALILAALQPNWLVRTFWAALIAISAAISYSFFLVSGTDLTVYDALSMWNARHEAGRALAFYQTAGLWAVVLVLAATFLVLAAPPVLRAPALRRYLNFLAWVPALPIMLMAAILLARNGSGAQAMPGQFQPLAVALVASGRIAIDEAPQRMRVGWTPSPQRGIRNIVLLVDESIRADYLDWRDGNPYTPVLAANQERFANFGPAASGANCSGYSNAILRLGGTRADLITSVSTNPTIWQYAKKAGFRTVYIDGQSGFIKSHRKLQNFMTLEELRAIDRHATFDDIPAPDLDLKVLQIIADELAGPSPVFIYANKNGAHFPYDAGYPQDQTVFTPTIAGSDNPTPEIRVNSYRNVVRWSVDHFFNRLLRDVDLSTTALLYTSDHGQHLGDGRMTHCTVENPDPRQGLVPLMALTGDARLMQRFQAAANLNRRHASHFAITPTVLELMAYPTASVAARYGPSLFARQTTPPAFTSEFIFGLFSSDVTWTPIDLTANYLEDFAYSQPTGQPALAQAAKPAGMSATR